jgi:GAF domain-containing protein
MTLTAVRPPRVADELGELALRMSAVLMNDHTAGSAVKILTSLSLNAVPNAIGAGVTLVGTDGARTSVAATSDTVLEADALQYHLNEGPCLDACLQAASVLVADLRLDRRWPTWTKALRPLNIGSLMSTPLVASGRVQGAVKIYCDSPGPFDEQTTSSFEELACTVALLLKSANPPDC